MSFPLLVRPIRLSIEAIDRRLEQAASTLGASTWQVFATVTLPLALPGILAGMVLGFAKAIGEFGATITFVSNIPGETQTISAAIYSKQEVDTGGGKRPVRLIFRDHPEWGRSAYLVLEKGDFDCYSGCKVKVSIDDGKPKAMAASRPKTDEAIAMFIEDEGALWRMAQQAKTGLSIEFPVKAGGTRTTSSHAQRRAAKPVMAGSPRSRRRGRG